MLHFTARTQRLGGAPARWSSAALAVFLFVFVSSQAQAASLQWDVWSDPQIALPVPRGWHRTEVAWVAERILIATPTPLSEDLATLEGGLETPAVIHVKIDALDPLLQGLPLSEVADAMVKELSERAQAEGLELEVLERGELVIGSVPAVKVVMRQGSTVSHVALFRAEGYLYEVTVGYDEVEGAAYEAAVAPVLAGVQPKAPQADHALETRTTLLARLPAPSDWHVRTIEGALPQVVISKEESAVGARYETGISLLKFSLQQAVSPEELEDLYELWLRSYVAELSGGPFRLLQAGEIQLGRHRSFLIEASFQDPESGAFTQVFNVITALGDQLYIATFEAPVAEFHRLRPIYLEGIAGLQWR